MFLTGLGVFTALVVRLGAGRERRDAVRCSCGSRPAVPRSSPPPLSRSSPLPSTGTQRAKALAAWGALVAQVPRSASSSAESSPRRATGGRSSTSISPSHRPLLRPLKVVPADAQKPRWRGLDLPGAALRPRASPSIVYGISQAPLRWLDVHPDARPGPRRTPRPRLLRAVRAHTRTRCCGSSGSPTAPSAAASFLMLAAAGSIFGLFLLCSLYLQNVLGTGPLATGLAFIPLALSAGLGAHSAGHLVARWASPLPLAVAFAVAAVGMALLARSARTARTCATSCPGCSSPASALGVAIVSVSVAILTGSRARRPGCCRASTRPRTRSAARSASRSSPRSPRARPARSSAGAGAPHRQRLPRRRGAR